MAQRRKEKEATVVAVATQYHMEFDREVVAGFLNYSAIQTDWTVDISAWNSGTPLRSDCDGYLIRGTKPAEKMGRRALQRSVIVTGEDVMPCPSVWVDDAALGEMAARHLLPLNTTSFLSVTPLGIPAFAKRHASFIETIAATGTEVHTVDLSAAHSAVFDPAAERRRIVKGLRELTPPIAVMCADAGTAYRVFGALHSIGLSVPGDAMVVACEDDEVAALACRPPLSAIDCRGRVIGYEAAALLHHLLEGKTVSTRRLRIAPGQVHQRASTQPTLTTDTAIRAALEFMRQRIRNPISVRDIAKHVGLSRRTLERLFRRETGRSPAAELLSMRLELASQLLSDWPLRITDVAARCGFRSVTHFNSQFRNHFHCTPSEYRIRRLAARSDRTH